jgi:hypothetical protein
MEKFIPYDKLQKKEKRRRDRQNRGSWYGLNPITRVPKNPKAYDRNKNKREDNRNAYDSYDY